MTSERERLAKDEKAWRRWGPYLSDRAWGTVREDYSDDGSAWDYFPHDHARSRVYRWNEDGIGGISDDHQRLCFAVALWNEKDAILKERLFGVTGSEGNHGEDVKEAYFYLDNTPSHSYMKMLYKYPQSAYPYADLVAENRRRSRDEAEYELLDTGIFADNRYFDVTVEYAKNDSDDVLIRITAINRGADDAPLRLLPTLWFRNTWSWGNDAVKPHLTAYEKDGTPLALRAQHATLGDYLLYCEGADDLLFTDNETNVARLYDVPNPTPYVKDGINAYIVDGDTAAVNPQCVGTKAAIHYHRIIAAGEQSSIRLRLMSRASAAPFVDFDAIFAQRIAEADDFYAALHGDAPTNSNSAPDADAQAIQRQALAGMLWSKQFYYYNVREWLSGDPAQPSPAPQRKRGRNSDWAHLDNEAVMSMPDTWEYPWFAAWDLAFHCIPLALIDPAFAKNQLDLIVREWYQHPNGAIPAYEWAFGDVNPPVLAWAAWRVYKIDRKQSGQPDRAFLESMFHKLMLNFTWWVNRKDSEGMNIFQGGFLGLDNIGVFDRTAALPTGGHLEQSDGTSWMAMFSLNMMTIALELAQTNHVYENIATKFFEHFLSIAHAMSDIGGDGTNLWDETDEFFYDVLHQPDGTHIPLRVRSLVGLIPLLAVETIESDLLTQLPEFKSRLEWYLTHRPDLAGLVSHWQEPGMGARRLLALVRGHRMKRLLSRMLDPNEFLSEYGVRSVSKFHAAQPYVFYVEGRTYSVGYEAGESQSGLFGGNSNWRGPVWFPINYLLIESLQKFHHYYGDDFKVACPTGSDQFMTLNEVAAYLSQRLNDLFRRDAQGKRPFNGTNIYLQNDPHWRDYILFSEYFHGDTGQGVGASHQTGWTGLVAQLIHHQNAAPDQPTQP